MLSYAFVQAKECWADPTHWLHSTGKETAGANVTKGGLAAVPYMHMGPIYARCVLCVICVYHCLSVYLSPSPSLQVASPSCTFDTDPFLLLSLRVSFYHFLSLFFCFRAIASQHFATIWSVQNMARNGHITTPLKAMKFHEWSLLLRPGQPAQKEHRNEEVDQRMHNTTEEPCNQHPVVEVGLQDTSGCR